MYKYFTFHRQRLCKCFCYREPIIVLRSTDKQRVCKTSAPLAWPCRRALPTTQAHPQQPSSANTTNIIIHPIDKIMRIPRCPARRFLDDCECNKQKCSSKAARAKHMAKTLPQPRLPHKRIKKNKHKNAGATEQATEQAEQASCTRPRNWTCCTSGCRASRASWLGLSGTQKSGASVPLHELPPILSYVVLQNGTEHTSGLAGYSAVLDPARPENSWKPIARQLPGIPGCGTTELPESYPTATPFQFEALRLLS